MNRKRLVLSLFMLISASGCDSSDDGTASGALDAASSSTDGDRTAPDGGGQATDSGAGLPDGATPAADGAAPAADGAAPAADGAAPGPDGAAAPPDAATAGPDGAPAPPDAAPPGPDAGGQCTLDDLDPVIPCQAGDDAPCQAVCGGAYCYTFDNLPQPVCTVSCERGGDCPDGWRCNRMGRCRPEG